MEMPHPGARGSWKIGKMKSREEFGVLLWKGRSIHDALFLCVTRMKVTLGEHGSTYQRVWPLVMAHSNGAQFLFFDAARRFVRAHASFIRSSTVSVCE